MQQSASASAVEAEPIQVEGTNWHTASFARRIREDTLAHRTRTVFDIVLHPPGPGIKTQWHSVLGLEVATEDWDDHGLTPGLRAINKLAMLFLPLTDPNTRWKSPEEAAEVVEQM